MYWDEESHRWKCLWETSSAAGLKECLVNSCAVTVVPSGLNTYFQMPFRKKVKITLENQHANPISGFSTRLTIACTRNCRRMRTSI
ncbi:MAG: DUF2961 domain-containing protein [[Clostridium] scindens]